MAVEREHDAELDRRARLRKRGRSRLINFLAFAGPFAIATALLSFYGDEAFRLLEPLAERADAPLVDCESDDASEVLEPISQSDAESDAAPVEETAPTPLEETPASALESVDTASDKPEISDESSEALESLEDSVEPLANAEPLNGDEFFEDEVLEYPEDEPLSYDASASLDYVATPEPDAVVETFDADGAERELAQLKFQFSQLKTRDVRELDDVDEELESTSERARLLGEDAPETFREETARFAEEVAAFQRFLASSLPFYQGLEALDEASLDADSTRAFFARYSYGAKLEPTGIPEIDAYSRELTAVAATLDSLDVADSWNEFIERDGEALERFYASSELASRALRFLDEYGSKPGVPNEIEALKKRSAEWTFSANNSVATQRKVLLRLEDEISKKYWTYAESPVKFYYLTGPARIGRNERFADADGTTFLTVDVPETAPETRESESPQKTFLRALSDRARNIPDDLRANDPARWYADWCEFLRLVQSTDRLDPILQYALFRDVARILASSDYFFNRRLAPLLRMLNAPQLEDKRWDDVRWQTDDPVVQKLRETARGRMAFLPDEHLAVDKTTTRLNEMTERCRFLYKRVGWLDRALSGDWICRRPSDAPLPVGTLFALRMESSEPPKCVWREIGSSDGRQATIKLASSELPRGAIVFCRVRPGDGEPPVVKRSSLDELLQR